MDEQTQPAPVAEAQPQVIKTKTINRNLILAIVALVIGAVIIATIFIISYPKQTTETSVNTTKATQVTSVTKTSDLDTATAELNSANLDSYQNDLNQINSSF